MIKAFLRRVLGWHELEVELGLLSIRISEISEALSKVRQATRMAALPTGLTSPVPKVRPEDLPPEVSALVDWDRLGIFPPEDEQ